MIIAAKVRDIVGVLPQLAALDRAFAFISGAAAARNRTRNERAKIAVYDGAVFYKIGDFALAELGSPGSGINLTPGDSDIQPPAVPPLNRRFADAAGARANDLGARHRHQAQAVRSSIRSPRGRLDTPSGRTAFHKGQVLTPETSAPTAQNDLEILAGLPGSSRSSQPYKRMLCQQDHEFFRGCSLNTRFEPPAQSLCPAGLAVSQSLPNPTKPLCIAERRRAHLD